MTEGAAFSSCFTSMVSHRQGFPFVLCFGGLVMFPFGGGYCALLFLPFVRLGIISLYEATSKSKAIFYFLLGACRISIEAFSLQ